MAPVIEAKNLFKRYPGFAPVLRGASLSVEPGEMVAIMGPSGCGKSTMLHILGLLHAPDSGTLEILGRDALALAPEEIAGFRRANLGFVMQASNLFEHSTVFENVEFPLIYDNVPAQERWARVIRALDLVRLSARVHYPSNRLSGGEQQRVAIARAMVNNPRILLADEPTGALDARTSLVVMENFRNLCHTGGVAMVMVTHDPKMADHCDTVYTLEDGALVCKKRGNPPFAEKGGTDFLKAPVPAVYGALAAMRFPRPRDPDLQELARRLHEEGMLARIYALKRNRPGSGQGGYALPLPVRRIGFWRRLMSLRVFFARARGSDSLWRMWRALPPPGVFGKGLWARLSSFAGGVVLARWGLSDNIQFFFAAGAGCPATAVWVASRLLRKPFAFQVNACDLARPGPAWPLKAKDAAFVVCPSRSILDAAANILPEADRDKLALIYPPPVATPSGEEGDYAETGDKFMEILAVGETSASDFESLLGACADLKKKGVAFRLSIQGKKSRRLRRLAASLDLADDVVFLGMPEPDSLGEAYKTARIFAAFPPAGPGAELELPLYVREAMAFGLGIACQGLTPGMAEALKPEQNCVSAGAGAEGLARALERLCGDPALLARLGAQARKDITTLVDAAGGNRLLADGMAMAAGQNLAGKAGQ